MLRLDRLALELRLAHDRLIVPLARAAAAFVGARAWSSCGAARLEDHARERFGRTSRWLRQLADLGGALERFPQLARALTTDDDGLPLGAEAARLVARAVLGAEAAGAAGMDADAWLAYWIARAREVPLRVLRAEVRNALSAGAAIGAEPDRARAYGGDTPPGAELDEEARCVVEIRMPAAVQAAFEEVLDLHRALAGRDVSLEAAVESILAEALADGLGPKGEAGDGAKDSGSPGHGHDGSAERAADRAGEARAAPGGPARANDGRFGSSALGIVRRPLGHHGLRVDQGAQRRRAARPSRASRASREARLERVAGGWAHLAAASSADPRSGLDAVLQRAEASLAEFHLLAASAGSGGPLDLDHQIARLVALEDALMRRLGEIALEFSRRGAWVTLGFTGIGHYAESRLGLPATLLEDRVRVARRLASLPLLREAYERGRLPLDALLVVLRTLGRGPVPDEVERAWLRRAREATVKRLRDEARALCRRALELPPETRDAVDWSDEAPREEEPVGPGEGVDAARGGPEGPARSHHEPCARGQHATPPHGQVQVLPLPDAAWARSLRREPGLARRRVLQAGLLALQRLDTSPDVFLRLRLPEALADDLLAAVESARRGLSDLADSVPWTQDWPVTPALPSLLAARTFSVRARRVPSWVGLLALLEDAALTWDDPRDCSRRPGDPVYRRDGFRCTAPGCTARAAIHDHHVVFRSRGGSDSPANRVSLCAAHHAALHERDTLAVAGCAPLDLTWRLGPPEAAQRFRCERRI
ncbi:MAG: HNH endonuclease [Acidobacteria bacterium]|nr:HNH endonuclease [Acidobacteriota bacterium]